MSLEGALHRNFLIQKGAEINKKANTVKRTDQLSDASNKVAAFRMFMKQSEENQNITCRHTLRKGISKLKQL